MFALGLVIIIVLVWSLLIEPKWLHLRRVQLKARKPLSKPLTVLHISDTHFPLHSKTLTRFFEELSGLKPDLIVLTGDIIDNDRGILPCSEAISKLTATYGKFAVLGNHDHHEYSIREIFTFLANGRAEPRKANDVPRLKEALKSTGCRVLVNESLDLDLEQGSLCLVGVDDPVTHRADFGKAFQNVNGADVRLLLIHSLDALPHLKEDHCVDFAFSGHTHGAQLHIPFYGPPPLRRHSKLGRKYVAGLSRYGDIVTYTSRGMGEGRFFPFRLFCRPEAVLFEIH